MAYEISQFDIADRQLLSRGARLEARTCTEIGNAKITESIFGKAKVRITCARDRIRRVRMLSAMLVLTIAIAIWQLTEHGTKIFGSAVNEPVNAPVQVSAPAFMPEYLPPSTTAQRNNSVPTQTESDIYQLTTRQPLPPPPQRPALPVASPPSTAGTPMNGTQASVPTLPLTPPVGAAAASPTLPPSPQMTKPITSAQPAPIKPIVPAAPIPKAMPITQPPVVPPPAPEQNSDLP